MLVRTLSAFAMLALSAFAMLALAGAAPALARPFAQPSVTPATVLAAKTSLKGAKGFADRTARLSSIMGPETGSTPLHVPTTPAWKHAPRRDADATGGIR